MHWIIAECGLVNVARVDAIRIQSPDVEVNGTHRVVAFFAGYPWTLRSDKERQKCVDWMNDLFLKLKEAQDADRL